MIITWHILLLRSPAVTLLIISCALNEKAKFIQAIHANLNIKRDLLTSNVFDLAIFGLHSITSKTLAFDIVFRSCFLFTFSEKWKLIGNHVNTSCLKFVSGNNLPKHLVLKNVNTHFFCLFFNFFNFLFLSFKKIWETRYLESSRNWNKAEKLIMKNQNGDEFSKW